MKRSILRLAATAVAIAAVAAVVAVGSGYAGIPGTAFSNSAHLVQRALSLVVAYAASFPCVRSVRPLWVAVAVGVQQHVPQRLLDR